VLAAALLLLGFCVLAALTWGTWGAPHTDAGAELTVADLMTKGEGLYSDSRYYYGPLGVSAQALELRAFGPSLTVAFAFGILQFAAILATFYALARTWLGTVFAGLSTAILLAIGFTGQLFGYILPHTVSATWGLLMLLLMLLALTRGHLVAASLALGGACLTRPEFAGAALAVGAAYLVGLAIEGRRNELKGAGLRLLGPGLGLAVAIFGAFVVGVGADKLVFENLFPVDFLRVSGGKFFHDWAPLTPASLVATLARALAYLAPLAGLAGSAVLWQRRPGVRALWPLAAAFGGLLFVMGLSRGLDLFPGSRGVVQTEAEKLKLGMSWLPALSVGIAGLAVVRAAKRRRAPLSGSWPIDLALIAAATILCLRAYNKFTTDVYSAYYAAPAVLLAGILHQWIGDRWRPARPIAVGALGAVALSLVVSALTGPSQDDTFRVKTARGSYLASATHGPALQGTIDFVRRSTKPGEPILALPTDGGLHFLTDRPPALYESMFVPGALDSRADERAAFAQLRRDGVRVAIVGNASFESYGFPGHIGERYNRWLLASVRREFRLTRSFGDFGGDHPGPLSAAYRVYVRR
jgi:hypothetical protein